MAAAGMAGLVVGVGVWAWRNRADANTAGAVPAGTPVVSIVEGRPGSPYPYHPAAVTIPVGRVVAIHLTDNLGGCGLTTVFEGLGVSGGNAVVTVPVGQTGVATYGPPIRAGIASTVRVTWLGAPS
ncbi:MAG: hypothetical protein K6V97_01185 [Actinomycetia bacterium]|nr:hypothetical protein [Actinomycetes bacterium]